MNTIFFFVRLFVCESRHTLSQSWLYVGNYCECIQWIGGDDGELLYMRNRPMNFVVRIGFTLVETFYPVCSSVLILLAAISVIGRCCMHSHDFQWQSSMWTAFDPRFCLPSKLGQWLVAISHRQRNNSTIRQWRGIRRVKCILVDLNEHPCQTTRRWLALFGLNCFRPN